MKTKNLKLDYIQPSQLNKEVFFNENLSIIDNFIHGSVRAFSRSFPPDDQKEFTFILTEGEHKNKICFSLAPGRIWQVMTPIRGMVFFCLELKKFVYFIGEEWVIMESSTTRIPERFEGATGDYSVSNSINWIYLNGHTNLKIKSSRSASLDIIIKQNHATVFNVVFDAPILWKAEAYTSSRAVNNIDYIKLIKLPETDHFLGEVVKCGFNY